MGKEMILDDFAFLVSETDEKGIIIFEINNKTSVVTTITV